MKIPKDFAAKPLTSHMATERKSEPLDSQDRGVRWIVIAACLLIIVIFGGSFFWFRNITTDQPTSIGPVAIAAEVMSATPFQPEQAAVIPTDTHTVPTRTAQPTKTPRPVSDNVQKDTIIEYEKIKVTEILPVEVEVIVTVIHTVVPEATHTPQPTVDDYATQAARLRKISYSKSLRSEFISWGITFAGSVTGLFFLLRGGWLTIQHWRREKLSPVEQSRDEIADSVKGKYWHPLYPDYRNRIWHLRRRSSIPADIVRDLWPQNKSAGGSHHVNVVTVLRQYDPLGEYGPTTPPPRARDIE